MASQEFMNEPSSSTAGAPEGPIFRGSPSNPLIPKPSDPIAPKPSDPTGGFVEVVADVIEGSLSHIAQTSQQAPIGHPLPSPLQQQAGTPHDLEVTLLVLVALVAPEGPIFRGSPSNPLIPKPSDPIAPKPSDPTGGFVEVVA
ncbi:cornifin-A-like, partial [Ornithodoros turicata]|uniref:cornifin-A-like n=1 Tax=Ornithodoros turicata TaxID=34597 RepID=UPI0031394466